MRLPVFANIGAAVQQWQGVDLEIALGHAASATVNIVTPIVRRQDASSTCAATDTSAACAKPEDADTEVQTLAIALGAGIPLVCAIIVLFFLHRRHVKRQRLEDLNDPHKSLDFGTGPEVNKKGGKRAPEMSVKKSNGRRERGLSMDIMGSPYMLPGELQGSRASLRSMTLSAHDNNDPYRPVTLVKNDWASVRAPHRANDNGSVYSAATSMQSQQEQSSLVANARPMSQSYTSQSPVYESSRSPASAGRNPLPAHTPSTDKALPELSRSPVNLDDFVPPPPPAAPLLPAKDETEAQRPQPSISSASASRPPRKSSMPQKPIPVIEEPFLEPATHQIPQLPQIQMFHEGDFDLSSYTSEADYHQPTLLAQPQVQNNRLSIVGLRPLPSDLPEDNPEQRANRIRSFYKEYFDDSRGHPKGGYVDDSDADYLADYAIYDPQAGGFFTANRPYAQPVARRAMTPPPRGAQARGPNPDRRPMSSQSGAMRGARGRAQSAPRKQLPPPIALSSLPTPYMLRNDSSIFNAIDFAPPTSFRDRQAGRAPDSPTGISRPYSPSVTAHIPLAASSDDLASVPSPHLLRKSSTFTGLDFALPPRFREQGTASDSGSIRSNRSGISAFQQNAIRQGAYRVSRIPTEMVSSRDDFANQLKPRWDMRNGSNIMG